MMTCARKRDAKGLIEAVTADEVYLLLSGAVTRLGLHNIDLAPLRAFADAYDETLEALRVAVNRYCTSTGVTVHSDAVTHTLTAQIELVEKWIRDVLNNGLNKSKKGILIDLAANNHSRVRFQLYNVASTYFKYKGLDVNTSSVRVVCETRLRQPTAL